MWFVQQEQLVGLFNSIGVEERPEHVVKLFFFLYLNEIIKEEFIHGYYNPKRFVKNGPQSVR